MQQKTLTMKEIKELYPDQWVLISYSKLDDDLEVIRGDVVASASSREEIYRKLKEVVEDKIAVRFTGEMPEGLAYLL